MATDNFKARRTEYFAAQMESLMEADGGLIKIRKKQDSHLQDSPHEVYSMGVLLKRRIKGEGQLRKL